MQGNAMERARERLAAASAARPDAADVSAVLERTHLQLVELSSAADGLAATLPTQVVDAVRDGVRREAAPMGRQVAEVRGMAVQLLRRLERLESDLAAERHARIDDLGLLVDLIGAGWQSVDERLARIEQAIGSAPATVHRLGDRRADAQS
jgi:hypothetical protein